MSPTGDLIYPDDLALLQRVFDRHCAAFGYRPKSPAAEDIADVVMTLFRMGYTDEAGLAEAVASREQMLKAS